MSAWCVSMGIGGLTMALFGAMSDGRDHMTKRLLLVIGVGLFGASLLLI